MSDGIQLPELVGVLATQPEHIRKVIEAYGAACARAAVLADRERRAQPAPELKHGCYCDIEPHMEPDGCVIDEGKPENCIYARGKTCKTQCEYWKPITLENNIAAGVAPDAGLAHLSPADEAVRRDAERYRWLRDRGFAHADVSLGTDCDGDHFVGYRITFNLPEPPHNKFEDDEWEADDIDAAIDAAIAQRGDVE